MENTMVKNKIYSQYPWLSYDESCDVLVVGGGLTAAFALYQLANNGTDAVMLTQKPVGFSSSCTNCISQYENEIMLIDFCQKNRKDEGLNYFAECENALNAIEQLAGEFEDVYFSRRDSLLYASEPHNVDRLHSEYLMRRHNGIGVEFLDSASARDMFSFPLKGAILAHNQAAEIDDYALCHALVKESEKKGSRIFENTTAVEIKEDDGGYLVISAYGKKVFAKRILLCLGKGVGEYLPDETEIKTTFSVVTNQLEGFSGYESRAVVRNMDKNITLHTTKDNSVIITGLDCTLLKGDSHIGRLVGVSKIADRKYKELLSILDGMLIGISSIEPLFKYSSEYLKTVDMLPIQSSLSSFNDIILSAPSGVNGVISSYIAASKIVADLKV